MPESALAQMLVAAINGHEAALARVGRLLHDEVSQVLSAVGLQLDAMRMDFRDQAPGIDSRAVEIQTMLEQAIEQLRDLSNEINPSIVERAGLQFALDRLAGKTRRTFSGALRVLCDPDARVPTPVAKAFHKIAEFALEDAGRQPDCSLIEIHLKRSQGNFVLEVQDNGTRKSAGGPPSIDWLLIDYYASQNNVLLETRPVEERGWLIRACYPLNAVPENRD